MGHTPRAHLPQEFVDESKHQEMYDVNMLKLLAVVCAKVANAQACSKIASNQAVESDRRAKEKHQVLRRSTS